MLSFPDKREAEHVDQQCRGRCKGSGLNRAGQSHRRVSLPFRRQVRVGDLDAERHAHALATTAPKSNGTMWKRDEVMPAIKQQLDMAADGGCPERARLRDS
jgi:hypothetical protein